MPERTTKKLLIVFGLFVLLTFSLARASSVASLGSEAEKSHISVTFTVGIPDSYYITGVPLLDQGPRPWCGPTSLAMVLNYWGYSIDVWTAGTTIDPEEDGSTVNELRDYASGHGFATLIFYSHLLPYRQSSMEELKLWICHGYPVVVGQWVSLTEKEGHFRVVVGYDTEHVYLNDPWAIPRKYSYDVFTALWDNDESLVIVLQSTTTDSDADDLTDAEELNVRTDAFNPDTDGDGLSDGQELKTYGTSPLVIDTDGDGLTDEEEVNVTHTDPVNPDTDGDGLMDGEEMVLGTDPLKADTDGDSWDDSTEASLSALLIFDPTNFWLPNGAIVGAVVSIVGATIYVVRKRRQPTPPVPPTPTAAAAQICPYCGGQLTWIQQHSRWYCPRCKQYR